MTEEIRNSILTEIAKLTGKQVSWRLIKQTSDFIPSVERFHNLITGIFKPAWSDYALSIVIRINSPYESKDEVVFLEDGRWLMTYSPRSGGLDLADNRALIKCMSEQVPLGVFRQVTDSTAQKHGSTYRVLGLGVVTGYDADAEVFIIESADRPTLEKVTNLIADEGLRYEIQIYSELTNAFQPFVKEQSVTYSMTALVRDRAFREIVTQEYEYTCAVCKMKFRLGNLIEATAAHIIPKRKNGTDDPRNGLSLCRTHHWAFDCGIFSLSDEYKILLSPHTTHADSRRFSLLDLHDKPIFLPVNETFQPHPFALRWHRENVWLS